MKQLKVEVSFRMMLKVIRKQLRKRKWDKSEKTSRISSKIRRIAKNLEVKTIRKNKSQAISKISRVLPIEHLQIKRISLGKVNATAQVQKWQVSVAKDHLKS